MKPIVTALGICALLFGAQTANAIDWQGDRIDGSWSDGLNWSGDSMPTCTDPAVITSKVTHWPFLNGVVDRYVASLTVGGGATVDMNGNTLFVDGTLTVSATAPAVDATLDGSGGTLRAEAWTFSGTVAFTDGTFECGAVTCP